MLYNCILNPLPLTQVVKANDTLQDLSLDLGLFVNLLVIFVVIGFRFRFNCRSFLPH